MDVGRDLKVNYYACHKPARHSWSLFMAGGSRNTPDIIKKQIKESTNLYQLNRKLL